MTAKKIATVDAGGDLVDVSDPTPAQMMQLAIQQGEAGVAALERLVQMRERAEDRAAAKQYARAIALFQQRCPTISKNAAGAHGARYSTLDHVMTTIRPFLAEAGLSVTFDSEELDDGRLRIWAVVHHDDGHSERAAFTVSREAKSNRMNDSQRDGSALSYGRRYALCMALGISTGDATDDDGQAAGQVDPVTAEQAATLIALLDEVKADRAGFLRYFRAESVDAVPANRYAEAVALLERKRRG